MKMLKIVVCLEVTCLCCCETKLKQAIEMNGMSKLQLACRKRVSWCCAFRISQLLEVGRSGVHGGGHDLPSVLGGFR